MSLYLTCITLQKFSGQFQFQLSSQIHFSCQNNLNSQVIRVFVRICNFNFDFEIVIPTDET